MNPHPLPPPDCHSPSVHPLKTSAHSTLHCLTGCTIGELVGLALGVELNFSIPVTIGLAFVLSVIAGMLLAVVPLIRHQSLSWFQAMKVVWLGEIISITVMEAVMDTVDWAMGGMQVRSMFAPLFWTSLAASIPAGFLAAWPVNHWLLKKALKSCH